jgi:hypothetical protein
MLIRLCIDNDVEVSWTTVTRCLYDIILKIMSLSVFLFGFIWLWNIGAEKEEKRTGEKAKDFTRLGSFMCNAKFLDISKYLVQTPLYPH